MYEDDSVFIFDDFLQRFQKDYSVELSYSEWKYLTDFLEQFPDDDRLYKIFVNIDEQVAGQL